MASDLLIDLYYYFHLHIASFHLTQLVNYGVYALIIWMGTRFSARSSWLKLLSGSRKEPSLMVAKRATSTSIPTADVDGWTGVAISRRVWK